MVYFAIVSVVLVALIGYAVWLTRSIHVKSQRRYTGQTRPAAWPMARRVE